MNDHREYQGFPGSGSDGTRTRSCHPIEIRVEAAPGSMAEPGSTSATSALARRVAMIDAQLAQLAATSQERPVEERRAETRQVVAMADWRVRL